MYIANGMLMIPNGGSNYIGIQLWLIGVAVGLVLVLLIGAVVAVSCLLGAKKSN